MLELISVTPFAATCMLDEMLCVTEACSSTEAAIADEISLMREIVCVMASMTLTALVVVPWTSAICALISSVAFAVWVARLYTSDATTAKPRPASPARAASMVALSASRLVCSAMLLMSLTTSPIFWAAMARPETIELVSLACCTA